jgi:polar amino acid transport system substrate-binding protein
MSQKSWRLIVCLLILVFGVATAFAYTTEQASNGKALYGKNCGVCHGANGEGGTVPAQFGKMAGTKASPVAGPGYLPKMKTAGEAYEFAKKNMPANKPGILKDSEYLDIISFALQANDVKPDGKALTPESAKMIKLAGGK